MDESILKTYGTDLARYCRMVAGTPWDGDDLYQETVVKALKNRSALSSHPNPKAYLFRIATNTWIDFCRSNKRMDSFEENDNPSFHPDQTQVIEAIETLVYVLEPRQAALILLIDVFKFTASETADILGGTEGAIKAALHRARSRLKREKENEVKPSSTSLNALIDAFMEAFRKGNPLLIVKAYNNLALQGVEVQRQLQGGRLSFTFKDPEGNIFMLSS